MERLRCDDDFGLGRAIQWYRTLAHFWKSFGLENPQKLHEESAMQKSRWTHFSVFLKCVRDDELYDVTCR